MVKYISQSFTTEHSTAEKKIISPIIEKKDLIYARWKDDNFSKYKVKTVCWKISKSSVSNPAYLYQFQYLSNLLYNNAAHP